MKKLRFFSFAFIFLLSLRTQTTYYFSQSGGNISNDGLTSSTPKQTLSSLQVLLNSTNPGDKLLLKRGYT